MGSKEFCFRGFNPTLSFSEGSIGFNSRSLIGLDGKIIDAPERLWLIGYKAFKYFLFKRNGESDLSLHEKNMQEVINYFETTYDFFWRCVNDKKITLLEANGTPISDLERCKCFSTEGKAYTIESFMSQSDNTGNFADVMPHTYFAYLSIKVIDELCELDLWDIKDCDVGIESDISHADRLLSIAEKYDAILQATKLKAKNAVNIRHQGTTFKVKEMLRDWHKNNRHEFLKPDGSLHQSDAAEHVCYVLKLTNLTARKVAEYMGEFERDFKKQ